MDTTVDTNYILLLNKGIIHQSGAICENKINLISGAMAAPLIESIWVFSEHDAGAMERVSVLLNRLYNKGHEA